MTVASTPRPDGPDGLAEVDDWRQLDGFAPEPELPARVRRS
jgi:hypothetical protein